MKAFTKKIRLLVSALFLENKKGEMNYSKAALH